MRLNKVIGVSILWSSLSLAAADEPTPTPTPTATSIATPAVVEPTPEPTPQPSPEPTLTLTPTPTPEATPAATASPYSVGFFVGPSFPTISAPAIGLTDNGSSVFAGLTFEQRSGKNFALRTDIAYGCTHFKGAVTTSSQKTTYTGSLCETRLSTLLKPMLPIDSGDSHLYFVFGPSFNFTIYGSANSTIVTPQTVSSSFITVDLGAGFEEKVGPLTVFGEMRYFQAVTDVSLIPEIPVELKALQALFGIRF